MCRTGGHVSAGQHIEAPLEGPLHSVRDGHWRREFEVEMFTLPREKFENVSVALGHSDKSDLIFMSVCLEDALTCS